MFDKEMELEYRRGINNLRKMAAKVIHQVGTDYNAGKMTKKEYDDKKKEVLFEANSLRRELLDNRKKLIKESSWELDRNLVSINEMKQDELQKFRHIYNEFNQLKDNNQIESEYFQSLKLGDQLSLKALAKIAHERMIKPVISDYSERDSRYKETRESMHDYQQRYHTADAKASDLLGDYRTIEAPREIVIVIENGWAVDNQGRRIPQYREKVLHPEFEKKVKDIIKESE